MDGFRGFLYSLLHPSLYFLPGMGIEEETVSHTLCHLYETAERNGETQLISSYPRTYRWVEKSDETTMALFLILYHCHGNHCAASRPEQRHHGIELVGVVESPSAQARQHIGCGKEQHSFRLRERRCLIYPDEVEIWLFSPLHAVLRPCGLPHHNH